MALDLKLTTLTPLWTGDVGMNMPPSPKVMGLGGSMRWWYEAIVRGLGITACDPTAHSCQSEGGALGNVCAACRLFGCTGWAQMFRLTTSGTLRSVPELHYQSGRRGGRGWFLKGGGCGEVNLGMTPLRQGRVGIPPDMPHAEAAMRVILSLIDGWGGAGARTQLGYGVMHFSDNAGNPLEPGAVDIDDVVQGIGAGPAGGGAPSLPALSHIVFAKFPLTVAPTPANTLLREAAGGGEGWDPGQAPQVQQWMRVGALPIAPAFRNHLRYSFGRAGNLLVPNANDQWLFFGNAPTNKRASRFNVACYRRPGGQDWEIRFWCWLPPTLGAIYGNAVQRNAFIQRMYDFLTDPGFWNSVFDPGTPGVVNVAGVTCREMNGRGSGRCTACPRATGCTNGEEFLRCLLG